VSIKYLEHIGIAVENLEQAVSTYETLLDTPCYKREVVVAQKVETAFLQTGESKLELLGATEEGSVIAKYIQEKGEGMHHVAFEVDDIRAEMTRLQKNGFELISDTPSRGADNKLVAFVHPKDNNGVLIELCETISDE